ncbi:MAG: hypothetical protein HYW63_01470 [Candidatus Levybacteria bacterium]|nr:hypothetical protein [Candidatus Levybacteria bacterium]
MGRINLRKTVLAIFFCFLILGAVLKNAIAQSPTLTPTPTPSKNRAEILRQIDETQTKISELQNQEKTLSSQIKVIDNQIKLTELKIESTKQQISDLTLDIDTADKKIDKLEGSLDALSKVLINRIKETYIVGTTSPFQILLSSGSVQDFIKKANYLRIAQAHDKRLIYDTVQAKNDYSNQKEIFEDKKSKIEQLKVELEGYNEQLDADREGKEQLLAITKNDEAKFQEILARLRADAASISRALGNITANIGPVNRGDIIASAGNTGCSTGAHLHFEVMTPARVEGEQVIGRENKVNPMDYINNGKFQHPLPNSIITTSYAQPYFLGVHTGTDFAYPFSEGPTFGRPIYAAEGGIAYLSQDSQLCKGFESNGLGKGLVIDHQNGFVTLYWHIP